MVKVGVSRFGHIGHWVTRGAFNSDKVDAVTIKDTFIDLNYMTCIFQYDSTHVKFKGTVKAEKRNPIINAKPISIFQERDPTNIKWGDAGAEYAVESTGEGCSLLEGGAKRISISAHSTDALIFAMGVNHEKYDNSLKIVSNASCSTSCLSSLAKVIHYNNGIVEELMTTVHAITATKKTMPGLAGKLCHDG
nr:glyceraldehyde-3-phosphate dehydrogenase-like [Mirounga angustirostris]